MFQNVGKKIMVYAQVLAWLSLIAGVITWVYFLSEDEVEHAFTWLFVGVFAFLDSWFFYGFGQLVDDMSAVRKSMFGDKSTATLSPREQSGTTVLDRMTENNNAENGFESVVATDFPNKKITESTSKKPIPDPNDPFMIACPICNARQRVGRKVCFECGVEFEI